MMKKTMAPGKPKKGLPAGYGDATPEQVAAAILRLKEKPKAREE